MAEATDAQMQAFSDQRIRVRAEQVRALKSALADDKAAIDDCYARATGTSRWSDNRTDGPPHLLQSGNAANPDDLLNFNSFADLFAKFLAGGFSSLNEANSAAAPWAVLNRACVRALPNQ
jgi:hypothetical protein